MKIPKIIHQTWKTNDIPEELTSCVESWKKLNPNWKYILWTDKEMDSFVEKHFPEFYKTYTTYPSGIFRADLFRLLAIYKMGGVYVDLDMKCIKSLDYLFAQHIKDREIAFSYENPIQSKSLWNIDTIYHAIFLAAEPKDEILKTIIQHIIKKGANHKTGDVVKVTGPISITESIKKVSLEKIAILHYKVITPIVDLSMRIKMHPWHIRKTISMVLKNEFYPETCMVHYWYHGYIKMPSILNMNNEELTKLLRKYDNPIFYLTYYFKYLIRRIARDILFYLKLR